MPTDERLVTDAVQISTLRRQIDFHQDEAQHYQNMVEEELAKPIGSRPDLPFYHSKRDAHSLIANLISTHLLENGIWDKE